MGYTKKIERDGQDATKIFDNRSLAVDYRTLIPVIKKGMKVLDIGCGTGSISRDIADLVGPGGTVVGLDNSEIFIQSGRESYRETKNLILIHSDMFDFETDKKFDLVIAARMVQWLNDPKAALFKMKSFLKPGGKMSILDYNHLELKWVPHPPESMKQFYKIFLKWRADAGMHNEIADELPDLMKEIGLVAIEHLNSDEHYNRNRPDFLAKVGIWSKVAGSGQMVNEGYLDDMLRLKAIKEYNEWVKNTAVSMTMKLCETRGQLAQ